MNTRFLLTRLQRSALAYCIASSYAVLPSFALAAGNNGVPALLQFAEQYQVTEPKAAPMQPAETAREGKKPPVKNSAVQHKQQAKTLRWQTKEAELQRERIANQQLKQQLLALQKSLDEKSAAAPSKIPAPDLAELSRLARGFRQALAITPAEQQTMANIEHTQQSLDAITVREQKTRSDNEALKAQLATLQTQLAATTAQTEKKAADTIETLNARLQAITDDKTALQSNLAKSLKEHQIISLSNENLKNQLIALNTKSTSQRQQQEELQRQQLVVENSMKAKVAELVSLRAGLTQLQERTPPIITPEILKEQQSRQNYAAGVSLGEEILQMQAERQKWGVTTDKQIMLTGIVDSFAGHKKMTDDELNQALAASEKQVTSARDKVMSQQAKKGDSYLTQFRQGKNVRQTASGAWYRVDYAGDAALTADATLDVVIKETLTDGTVIQDMENSGAVLSQPITRFPPLFSEALEKLNNHGSLTLVVPPELAYGAKGYPPNVPPNATMIYTLRITDMYPATAGKKTATKIIEKPIGR